MICKRCGKDNQDDVSFCASCGNALEEPTPIEKKSIVQKLLSKKTMAIISGAAALVLVLIIVIAIILSNGAKRAVNHLYEDILEYDYKAVVGFLPPAVVDHIKSRLSLEDTELEVTDTKELTPVYIAEIDKAYGEKYDTNKGYIENAAIVYVDIKWKGDPLTRDRISVYMVEIEGKWYFDPLTTFGEFPFEELPELDFD